MFLNKSLNLRSLVIRLTVTLVLIGWVGSTGAVSSTPEIPPLASIGAAQAVPRPLSDLPIGMMVHPPSLDYFNDVARSDDIGAVLVVSTGLLPRITSGKRLVMSPSVDLAEENAAAFVDDAEYLGYNVEHWPDTPDAEQADPATASANAAEFADRHDLGYVIGPDLQFTEDFGAELAQPADIYVIQGQRIQEDVAFFATTVNAFARNVRSGNPDVKVWVQVSSSFGTPEATIEALKEVAGQIDGIWVHYNQNAQSFATLQDLMKLLRQAAQANTPAPRPSRRRHLPPPRPNRSRRRRLR